MPSDGLRDRRNDRLRRCLLAIHAHPDDEASKGAGTMARYAAEGVRVVLVCATGGEAGDILNPAMDRPDVKDKLAEVRRAELEMSATVLGVEQTYFLGYRDSGMPGSPDNADPKAFANADPTEAVGRLVEIIRKERPDVILGYDEHKGYEHPDHIKVHEWGTQAWHEAANPSLYPEAGPVWATPKLYNFATWTRVRLSSLHDAALAASIDSPYAGWLENWAEIGFTDPEITTQIDVSEHVEARTKALLAHATQIDPESFWFVIPDEMHRNVYPWEDYTLVSSRVPTDLPETDLFAGL